MIGENRTPLNPLFCEYHWSQYRSDSAASGEYAIKAVSALVMSAPKFIEAIGKHMKHYHCAMDVAAVKVLADHQRVTGRAICCWPGDQRMAQVLKHSKNPPAGWKADATH